MRKLLIVFDIFVEYSAVDEVNQRRQYSFLLYVQIHAASTALYHVFKILFQSYPAKVQIAEMLCLYISQLSFRCVSKNKGSISNLTTISVCVNISISQWREEMKEEEGGTGILGFRYNKFSEKKKLQSICRKGKKAKEESFLKSQIKTIDAGYEYFI